MIDQTAGHDFFFVSSSFSRSMNACIHQMYMESWTLLIICCLLLWSPSSYWGIHYYLCFFSPIIFSLLNSHLFQSRYDGQSDQLTCVCVCKSMILSISGILTSFKLIKNEKKVYSSKNIIIIIMKIHHIGSF